jgi:hypothetical protein
VFIHVSLFAGSLWGVGVQAIQQHVVLPKFYNATSDAALTSFVNADVLLFPI